MLRIVPTKIPAGILTAILALLMKAQKSSQLGCCSHILAYLVVVRDRAFGGDTSMQSCLSGAHLQLKKLG